MHGIMQEPGGRRRGWALWAAILAVSVAWVGTQVGGLEPRRQQATAVELAQAETPKSAAAKSDAAKTETAKVEPTPATPPKSEPGKPEPAKPEPVKPEGEKPAPAKAEAAKPDAAKSLPAKSTATDGKQSGKQNAESTGQALTHAEEVFIRVDVDRQDGQISRTEYAAAEKLGEDLPGRNFEDLDTNEDGFLSLQEFSQGYSNWWLVGLIVLAVLVLPFVAGHLLAKQWLLPEYSLRFGIILFALTAALTAWFMGSLKFGIDLRGGVILVYGIDEQRTKEIHQLNRDNPNAQGGDISIDELVSTISLRVNPGGTKEVVVRSAGPKQIEIIIPDATKADIESTKRRVSDAGYLELMLTVNERNQTELLGSRYQEILERAKKPEHPQIITVPRGDREEPVAQWIVVDQKKFKNIEEEPNKSGGLILRTNRDGLIEALMSARPAEVVSGWDVAHASSGFDQRGQPAVFFTMTPKGAAKLQALTSSHLPDNTGFHYRLAIVYDRKLHTAPTINGAISDRGEITGYSTSREVQDIVTALNAGRMSAVLKEQPESEQEIGATLGEDTIIQSRRAAFVSVGVIFIFSLVYYKFAGFVACLVLLTNTLLLLGVMVLFKVALTLPGVAGLVLNIGMAVDANILIYERMREEREKGASLRMQIRNGFDKAASAIIDSNLTTLLTAIVLWVIGTDQVKGFAATLTIGILNTLFTAIFVGRVIFEVAERKRWIKEINMLKLIGKTNIDFIGIQRIAVGISVVACVLSLAFVTARGKGIFDIDFAGGTSVQILLNEPLEIAEVRQKLAAIPDLTVSAVKTESGQEKTHYKIDTSLGSDVSVERAFTARDKNRDGKLDLAEFLSEYPGQATTGPDYLAAKDRFTARDTQPTDGFLSRDEFKIDANDVKDYWLRPIFGPALRHNRLTTGEPTAIAATSPAPSSTAPSGNELSKPADGKQSSTRRPINGLTALATNVPAMAAGLLTAQDEKTAGDQLAEKSSDQPAPDKQPAASKPIESKPAESKPDQSKSAAVQQPDDKPTDVKPTDVKPANAKPTDVKAADSQLPDAKPSGAPAGGAAWTTSCPLTFADPIAHSDVVAHVRSAMDELVTAKKLPANANASSFQVTRPQFRVGDTRSYHDWTLNTTFTVDETRELAKLAGDKVAAGPNFPGANMIGGQVAGQTQQRAVLAIFFSILGIIAYLWVRFEKVMYGVAAAIALIHDVLITLGAVAVSAYLVQFVPPLAEALALDTFKISLPVIAALLTIVGYSVNDTIVIFDRIREIRGKSPHVTPDIINLAVNSTLSRSILTSFATLLSALVLYAAGGDEIHPFAFCICVGVIAGSYSTIYIASPILLWLNKISESRAAQNRRTPVSAGA